ncbi:MAG: hypothetical protein HC859_11730, partial [Bacteroidia bacterium]|nr:hypothetical protein [Bacteroidia bacterium]
MIRKYMENFGFQDISIIDPNTGFVVYSTRKEVDFATNLFTGPFAKTNVAKAFDMARSLPEGRWSLADFSNYVPSMGAPASFIATPVYDRSAMVGVVVFRLGIDEINNKMTGNQQWKRDGLGETGESYLLGPDSRMRSDARRLIEDKF